MTVSGLLIFLPILSTFVGAIIGAWANSWYRNREAKKAEDREREGLLRIIDAEVYENNRLLKDMIAEPHIADKYPSRTALNTAVWDDSRTKLSQLLATDQEHIVHLTRHYAVVGRIRAPLGDPDAPISARNKRERQARTANIREKRYILLSQLANLGYTTRAHQMHRRANWTVT